VIADAMYNHSVFGHSGLSLWLVTADWPLDRVISEKARKARRVALFSAGDLLGLGLGLVPFGKVPHCDTTHGPVYDAGSGGVQATAGSAEELVDRFVTAAYAVVENAFYEQDPKLRGGLQ
jgi:hypothetical protein